MNEEDNIIYTNEIDYIELDRVYGDGLYLNVSETPDLEREKISTVLLDREAAEKLRDKLNEFLRG